MLSMFPPVEPIIESHLGIYEKEEGFLWGKGASEDKNPASKP